VVQAAKQEVLLHRYASKYKKPFKPREISQNVSTHLQSKPYGRCGEACNIIEEFDLIRFRRTLDAAPLLAFEEGEYFHGRIRIAFLDSRAFGVRTRSASD
jgi:hypothetical protein